MELITKIENKIRKESLTVFTFLGTVGLGLLVHLYMVTNKLYNYFEMNNILTPMSYDKGDTLAMGRWFLPIVSKLSSLFSMPVINGLICFSCLGVTACLLCSLFGISSRLLRLLTGGVLVSFPGVASYLSYGVNCDVFSVAILLAVLSAYVISRKRTIPRAILSAVLLCFTVATYQPFMSVTIAVLFASMLLNALRKDETFKESAVTLLWNLAAMAAGFVLYYVVLKIFNALMGIAVGNYHGIGEVTSFTIKGICKGFVYTYFYFLRYFFTTEYAGSLLLITANVVLALLLIGLLVRAFLKNKKSRLVIALYTIFLPLGVGATPFLMADRVGAGVDRYMMFSFIILYVLVLALLQSRCEQAQREQDSQLRGQCDENLQATEMAGVSPKTQESGREIATALGLIALLVVIICNSYIVNQGYFRAEAMTVSENNLLNRMLGRIETYPEYTQDMPVYMVGADQLFNENMYEADALSSLPVIDGTQIKPWYNYDAIVKYLEVYMSARIVKPSSSDREKLDELALSEGSVVEAMPLFPAEGSLAVVDGVLVVKISNPQVEE